MSKRLQGATQTRIRVEGPAQEVQNALRALPGVSDVVSEEQEAEDLSGQMYVVLSEDRSVTHEIAKIVVNRGWQLQELNPVTAGLEELFVRLTKEEQRPAA